MSFNKETMAEKVGADAEVPPMLSTLPPTTTWNPIPKAATSGVPIYYQSTPIKHAINIPRPLLL